MHLLRLVEPIALSPQDVAGFKQAFVSAGEEVIQGGAGLGQMDPQQWLRTYSQCLSGSSPHHVFFVREQLGYNRDKVPRTRMGAVVGILSVRPELVDMTSLALIGHVSCSVLPGVRGRGYGRDVLNLAINYLRSFQGDEIMLTCFEDNYASRKMIEACNGKYHDSVTLFGLNTPLRRYTIVL